MWLPVRGFTAVSYTHLDVYKRQIRYDVGDKFGFIKATIDFALDRPELKDDVMKYILEVAEKAKSVK